MQKVYLEFVEDSEGEYTEWRFAGVYGSHPHPNETERELLDRGISVEEHDLQP